MKCNIVPFRQNWRDWELHHNKSNGYYCTHFTFSLFLSLCLDFTHYFSPSPPFTFPSIFALQLCEHTHTPTETQKTQHIPICLNSRPEKHHYLFTISSILNHCIGFPLQLENLKANKADASLCPPLHPKKKGKKLNSITQRTEDYTRTSQHGILARVSQFSRVQ